MNKNRLKSLGWKAMEFMKSDKTKQYNQIDLMEALHINIIEAIEVSDFLVKMRVCKYD